MAKSWRIGEMISYGWEAMKKNFVLFLFALLILIAVRLVPHLFQRMWPIFVVLMVVMIVALIILKMGLIRMALNIVDGKKAELEQLWSQPSLFPDYFVGTILYLLIVAGGLILLIVPGIMWALKYQFYGFAIVDKKLGPVEALKRSGKITSGHRWKLLGLDLTAVGVNILGVLALLVGLFLTIPTTTLALTKTYRTLDKNVSSAKKKK